MSDPCRYRVHASFDGVALAWGSEQPDERAVMLAMARSIRAMPLGPLDGDTSVSVALIEGAGAANGGGADEPSQRCFLAVEVKSATRERAEEVVGEVVDAMHEAANSPGSTCDLQVHIESPARPEPRGAPLALGAAVGGLTA